MGELEARFEKVGLGLNETSTYKEGKGRKCNGRK